MYNALLILKKLKNRRTAKFIIEVKISTHIQLGLFTYIMKCQKREWLKNESNNYFVTCN